MIRLRGIIIKYNIYILNVNRRLYFISMSISFVLIIMVITQAYANPIAPISAPFENLIFRLIFITILFFITTLVEYYFFKRLLVGRKLDLEGEYKIFLRINTITYPFTQILAYIFYLYLPLYFWYYVIFIEIAVVFTEWALLKIEFYKIRNEEISSRFILFGSIFANLLSFSIGLIGFIPNLTFMSF